ncbi:MAG: MBL fold metallo-hydrolase [Candidatus Eisenbacteria bacterium]|mgnify:CR=1 FL=1|nr:MBL fold metallo-hydrolase [Candidatus Eisenbacteria bacterium]
MVKDKNDITVDKLREWLEKGKAVSVLDVRPTAEWAEWSIPGSIHLDAYQKLWDSDPLALAGVALPADVPVVAVCSKGRTSQLARERLEAAGYKAYSLVGGMKSWSLAWNMAEVPVSAGRGEASNGSDDVTVLQFRRTGKGCLSYLVAAGGRAVVIDPSLDPKVYLEAAAKRGWKIAASLDTHVHADHLSRARAIEKLTGAPVALPETTRVSYPHQAVRDSDALPLSSAVALTAMRTPGHTPESVCWRLDNRILFTGDTLFVDAVGRPDLAANAKGAEQRAHALWRSLEHLFTLPPGLLVLPAHTDRPVPFDRKPIMATLGQVREAVSSLPRGEKDFVAALLSRIPPPPPSYDEIVKFNEKGTFPPGDPTDLEAGANRCAVK